MLSLKFVLLFSYEETRTKTKLRLSKLNEEDNIISHHDLVSIRHSLEGCSDFGGAECAASKLFGQVVPETSHGKRLSAGLAEKTSQTLFEEIESLLCDAGRFRVFVSFHGDRFGCAGNLRRTGNRCILSGSTSARALVAADRRCRLADA